MQFALHTAGQVPQAMHRSVMKYVFFAMVLFYRRLP